MVLMMMERIDVRLPPWALRIGDRVNLDTKIMWAIGGACTPRAAGETGGAGWLRSRLNADERALLRPGIASLIQSLGRTPEPLGMLRDRSREHDS